MTFDEAIAAVEAALASVDRGQTMQRSAETRIKALVSSVRAALPVLRAAGEEDRGSAAARDVGASR